MPRHRGQSPAPRAHAHDRDFCERPPLRDTASSGWQENGRRQKTMVCEKFDQLYSMLEERKREMSQKVTDEQEEKTNYIRGLTRKYGDHLEQSCKVVEMGIQTMEEPEMALFLQVRLDLGFKESSLYQGLEKKVFSFLFLCTKRIKHSEKTCKDEICRVDTLQIKIKSVLFLLSPSEHEASAQKVSVCFRISSVSKQHLPTYLNLFFFLVFSWMILTKSV